MKSRALLYSLMLLALGLCLISFVIEPPLYSGIVPCGGDLDCELKNPHIEPY